MQTRDKIRVFVRNGETGNLDPIELKTGDKIIALRGFGLRGESKNPGTILTVGTEVPFDVVFLLIDTGKAKPYHPTPFDQTNQPPKAKAK